MKQSVRRQTKLTIPVGHLTPCRCTPEGLWCLQQWHVVRESALLNTLQYGFWLACHSHVSLSSGRNVTLAVICLMMAWISWVMAASLFSTAGLHHIRSEQSG